MTPHRRAARDSCRRRADGARVRRPSGVEHLLNDESPLTVLVDLAHDDIVAPGIRLSERPRSGWRRRRTTTGRRQRPCLRWPRPRRSCGASPGAGSLPESEDEPPESNECRQRGETSECGQQRDACPVTQLGLILAVLQCHEHRQPAPGSDDFAGSWVLPTIELCLRLRHVMLSGRRSSRRRSG